MLPRKFQGTTLHIATSTYVDDTSVLIGDVSIGEDSSIWPTAVLRADVNTITIGARTNIQDGTVIHVSHKAAFNPDGYPVWVGDDVTIAHRVILHGCTIHHHCLIGMGSILMDGVVVEPQVMVGAGSLVPPGKILKSGYLWLGNPAKEIRPLTDEEKAYLDYSAQHYVKIKNRYILAKSSGEMRH
ncbi:MAG: gamma carbonic anhydrase family protein [Gammaproteobacteria bacterium]|jgi:carbonic anhydrase/acetyltransferase-like protein (isoleucine patch superfamily)|nr:gamma carbonic anhydrase family protein [Gammaproteobacteria bacterium]